MKKKLNSLLMKMSAKGFVVTVLITAMLASMSSAVLAAVYTITDQGNGIWTTNRTDTAPFSDEGADWFYRTSVDDDGDEWTYGYGYGPDGYGYGFGYGYDYINADGYDWSWPDDYLPMGTFMNEDYGKFSLGADEGVSGPIPVALELGGVVAEGWEYGEITIYLPAGITLTYSGDGEWSGDIKVGGADTSVTLTDFDAGDSLFVTVDLLDNEGAPLDGDVLLNLPVVVQVPYAGFDGGLVQATFGGDVYDIEDCVDDQYDAKGDMDDPASYTLAAAESVDDIEHCYEYDDDNVYIATNHFSEFGAGAGSEGDDDDDDDTGGGSSGGSSKKLVVDSGASSIADFVDLVTMTSEDWEYDVIKDAFDLGLFQGEKNAAGEPVFNPYNNMNRAEAAQVISNYIDCEDTTLTVAPFSDVALDVWYAEPVACLKAKGIVSGKTATTFDPAANVTRMEFFKMTIEAYLYLHPEMEGSWSVLMDIPSTYFADVMPTDWFYGYSNLAVQLGLLNGYLENGLHLMKPNQAIYRVEGAAMMVRVVGL